MTAVFLCGKGAGAEAVFRALLASTTKVAVWTHPGEGLLDAAIENRIIHSTASVNEMDAWPFVPALIVSVGYLTIVSRAVLSRVPGINCHYSLLPLHRGRSSVPWAILEGDGHTGISWHWMLPTVDTGNLLVQAAAQIDPHETAASLFDKLHLLVGETWASAFRLARSGAPGWAQVGKASRHPAGPPDGGRLRKDDTAQRADRMIRAMTFPPLSPATLDGRPVTTLAEFLKYREEP